MNDRRLRMLCGLLPIFISACAGGGGSAIVHSEAQTLAATQLERGIRAQQKGEAARAEQYLTEALRISSSIEDNPARIAALVNLARLNRLNSKTDPAALFIDQALKLSGGSIALIAEAAYEKALIELARNHHGEALTWATTALSAEHGEAKGRHLNLIARIHRAAGNRDAAALHAARGRDENRRSGLEAEESNSLRLLGVIERENGRFVESARFLREALAIDKRIGESARIALDLEELAALSGDQGDTVAMIDYLERAASVHLGGARRQKAAAAHHRIAEIHRKAGNTALAEKSLQAAEQLLTNGSLPQKSSSDSANPSRRP